VFKLMAVGAECLKVIWRIVGVVSIAMMNVELQWIRFSASLALKLSSSFNRCKKTRYHIAELSPGNAVVQAGAALIAESERPRTVGSATNNCFSAKRTRLPLGAFDGAILARCFAQFVASVLLAACFANAFLVLEMVSARRAAASFPSSVVDLSLERFAADFTVVNHGDLLW
jgi:hypothetical protein